METVEITAGRLHLRPWQATDAPAVYAACQDPAIQRYTRVPSPYSERNAREFVERSQADWATGQELQLAVLDATDGRLLASVGLTKLVEGRAEIGFWCVPAERGRGVIPEAVGVVCRWAFAALGLDRITWYAETSNLGSRRAAEKAGFTVEGTLRSYFPVARGGRADAWVGSRLATDPDPPVPR